MDPRRVAASNAISEICADLGYSRAHVSAIMRKHRRLLEAKKTRSGRWFMPQTSVLALHNIVLAHSGPRYKLGERGART
jgi:hypothetical protein